MKYEKIKDGIVNILNSLGYEYKFFNEEGSRTSNPYEAKYIFVDEPNIMFIIEDNANSIEMHKSNVKISTFKKILRLVRSLTTKYFVNLEVSNYNQAIRPKDFSKDILRKRYNLNQKMSALDESVIMGGKKTFYESYGDVVFFHEKGTIKRIDRDGIEVLDESLADYIPALAMGVSTEKVQFLLDCKKNVANPQSRGNLFGKLVDEREIEHKIDNLLKSLR